MAPFHTTLERNKEKKKKKKKKEELPKLFKVI